MRYSVAVASPLADELATHLLRPDGQEDLCFGVWFPSHGHERLSAVVAELILPRDGERNLHGNVSFEAQYLLRAGARAAELGGGLLLAHSHPGARGWQGMSPDDVGAEHGHAAQALSLTGQPLLGLTMAGDHALAGRFWEHIGAREYRRAGCESVRVIGDRLDVTFDPALRPSPAESESQARTLSAWGSGLQADLARLRIGIAGAGSVGALVAETLARTGVGELVLVDFDSVEPVNLDRLLHARRRDVQLARSKVEMLARALPHSATHPEFQVVPLEASVVEENGFRALADCDLIFSCVDRPWARHALNLLATAHLIPVVDGGIAAQAHSGRLRRADWRAHLVAPDRRCLRCLGQYDLGLVDMERRGDLDDPRYIAGLPEDHPVRRRENVFAFSAAVASLEVLQLLTALIAPSGLGDPGAQIYHFVGGRLDTEHGHCETDCPFTGALAYRGDLAAAVTGQHPAAERARAERRAARRALGVRLGRWWDRLLKR
jgi:molybdopterin-synthase adenylyltransferase